jgi:hypothetical protein
MTVIGFSSWDDMERYLTDAEEAANRRIVDAQREITYGSLWLRFHDPLGRVVIFGQVSTLDEIKAKEMELGASEGEADHVVKHTQQMNERGFLFGTCWSTIEPRGELGNTHRSEVWYCPPAVFEEAKAHGWNVDSVSPWAKEGLEALYQQWRRRG